MAYLGYFIKFIPFVLWIDCNSAMALNGSSTVITLQASEKTSSESFLAWDQDVASDLNALTLCYRMKIFYYRPEVTVFSFIGKDNLKIKTDHNRRGMQITLSRHGLRVSTDIITPLMYWSSFCFGFDAPSKKYSIFFNDEKWKPKTGSPPDFTPKDNIMMEKGGSIVLGQDQEDIKGGYDATQSFCGQITDVNVWSRMLTDEEMSSLTRCQSRFMGDVINWETAQWIFGNDTETTSYLLARTCKVNPIPFFLFANPLKFDDSLKLCKAFGGEIATPRNKSEQQLIYSLALKEGKNCYEGSGSVIWVGIHDKTAEGHWIHSSSNQEKIIYNNWADGQPNGNEIENCAAMKADHFKGTWHDIPCTKSFKVCTMCRIDMPVFIRFRGICDANLYDDRYILKGKMNNQPYFKGYYRSRIFYNGTRWKLENININNTFALMEESGSFVFPIGRHKWIFSHGFCGEAAGELQSLTLTQCAKDAEFTCDDGTCIPINQVCNRRVECEDKSDELDCSTVLPPKGYQSTLPPPNIEKDTPLPVYLNLTLSSFYRIEPVKNEFAVELIVRMIWKDLRLQFKHLRRDRQLNIILPTEAKSIWVPVIDFVNTENNIHTLVDADCKITIKRLGNPLGDNIEDSKEARVYIGQENYIRINRKYSIPFTCNFDFFNFPFNINYCNMIFRINKNTDTYVVLNMFGPGIRYEGPRQLVEYEIGKISMTRYNKTDEPYSGLIATIQLKHLFATQIVTIYTPTTMLNLIGFMTFFFKWFDFQNRIMVSLTSLLVMTTLFSQISDTLPKSSYIKMIDIWFIFSIGLSFVMITFHFFIEYYHQYHNPSEIANLENRDNANFENLNIFISKSLNKIKDENSDNVNSKPQDPYARCKSINRWGIIITATTYVVFLIVFWGYSFKKRSNEEEWDIPKITNNATISYPD